MFKEDRCNLCGECLERCQWIQTDHGQAVTWMQAMMAGEATPVLGRCITCYACNEYCPQNANPFDLIASLQEKYRVFLTPEAVYAEETKYEFTKELNGIPRAKRLLDTCLFEKTDPNLLEGELYQLPRIGGKPYFCWMLFSHMGAASIQEKHARVLVERLTLTGASEIICFHDDCYAMLAHLAPEYGIEVPFRPVHLAEYLVEYLRSHPDRIRPLDMDIAYQRPCASRHTPEKEHFIDELFGLIGVRRIPRQYDREEALCCAAIQLLLGNGDPREAQEYNILDAKENGAQAMVCLCPMCMHNLEWVAGGHEMPLLFLGDLVRMSLGEIDSGLK